MSTSFLPDTVHRFIFSDLGIRGALVQLDESWLSLQKNRDYPLKAAALLGELASISALMCAELKRSGRLSFQLRGEGAISLLLMNCEENAGVLNLRGMLRCEAPLADLPVRALLGGDSGQLLLSLDLPRSKIPYQSIVPLLGETMAEIFEHYLAQSAQQPSFLMTSANAHRAACFFLQKLPESANDDADAWDRLRQFARTLQPEEMQTLDAKTLLTRLFYEELDKNPPTLFAPQRVRYHAPFDRDKAAATLKSLGETEARGILAEKGEIHFFDELGHHDYFFNADDVDALFSEGLSGDE